MDDAYCDMMLHAFEEAADGIENWEYGGADSKEEHELARTAAKEVAKRIRAMAKRYYNKTTPPRRTN